MAVLFSAGVQAPVIPLVDVVGKGESASPEQIAGTALKLGVMRGFTVMFTVTGSAHNPAVGVNV